MALLSNVLYSCSHSCTLGSGLATRSNLQSSVMPKDSSNENGTANLWATGQPHYPWATAAINKRQCEYFSLRPQTNWGQVVIWTLGPLGRCNKEKGWGKVRVMEKLGIWQAGVAFLGPRLCLRPPPERAEVFPLLDIYGKHPFWVPSLTHQWDRDWITLKVGYETTRRAASSVQTSAGKHVQSYSYKQPLRGGPQDQNQQSSFTWRTKGQMENLLSPEVEASGTACENCPLTEGATWLCFNLKIFLPQLNFQK